MKPAVIVPCSEAQSARKLLEEQGLWDKTRKLQKHNGSSVLIPVNTWDTTLLYHHLLHDDNAEDLVSVVQMDLPPSKSELLFTPAQQLLAAVRLMLERCGDSLVSSSSRRDRLLREVPSHWEKHGDLVLLPASAFASAEWESLGQELWQTVARCTGARRVARQSVVSADGFRTPQVSLLLGESAVVQHVDNGIMYEYDLTRCMFSAGNISEKLRVAKFSCEGETVVDLYAGMGYFTLPYLVHAGASHVHACEWNPDAVAALRRNLQLNGMETRCTLHPGDNRQLELRGVADRVNLGLIPSSEEGWPVACGVLKPTGGLLHVHANVNTLTCLGEQLLPHPQAAHGPSLTSLLENTEPASPPPPLSLDRETEGKTQEEGTQTDVVLQGREGEVGSRTRTPEKVQQVRTQTDSVQDRNKEVGSRAQTCSLFKGSGSAVVSSSLEPVSRTNRHTEGAVSRPTSVSPKAGEESMLDCAVNSEVEGGQFGGEVGEGGMSAQQDCHSCADVPSAADSLPPPERIPQSLDSKCDSVHYVQNEQPCSRHDCSLSKPRSAACCDRHSQPHVSLMSSDTQQPPGDVTHGKTPCSKTAAWHMWGDHVCRTLKGLLEQEHGGCWCASVSHIEPVKSYAPHVHHIVLDIRCTPLTQETVKFFD